MTIVEKIKEMKLVLQDAEIDVERFEAGKRGSPKSGITIRKQMRLILHLAKSIQQDVQQTKKVRFEQET